MEQTKVSLYERLNGKLTIAAFVAWALLYGLAPIHHADPTTAMPDTSKAIFRIYTVIPTLFLLLMIAYERGVKGWLMFYYKPLVVKFWTIVTYATLPVLVILDTYIMASGQTIAWGTFSSLGLMMLCTILIANRLQKQMGEVKALSIGVIAAFFFMMIWELIYQFWCFWLFRDIMFFPNDHILIVMPILAMIFPFMIVTYFYQARLTKWSWVLLGVFSILLFVWLVIGQGWVMVDWGGTGIGWVQRDMNWPVYHIIRVSKIPLALLMGSLAWQKSALMQRP